jgi:hypothetical protein
VADKEATLKLSLKADGFKKGLGDAEKEAKKAGSNIGKELSKGLSDAGKAGLDALKGSISNVKSALAGIAGIGAGVGIVDFARRAIASEGAFKKLAFQIRAGTGEMKNWRDMQREAQATALKFGHTSEEIGKSISDLYAAVGDPKFAQDASKVVAEFATGAHEPLETMTNLAGGLNEKFGITAQELPDVLANVVSLGNKGGVSVGDLADKIGIIGANARGAGLQGKKGFELLVGMLNIADNATGTLKKGITGVTGIIEGITNNTLGDSLKKNLNFDLAKAKKEGLEFDDILGQIIEKSGGKHDNLAKVFAGDQLKVVTELAKVYQEGFDSTQGTKQEKTKAAWAAYEKAIQDASKSALSVKDIQEEAAREMETPEKKIATAMEKLAQLFTSEKMSAAFKQLADFIPKVVDQMMKHPLLTGALLSGVPSAIVGSVSKSLVDMLGKVTGMGGGGVQAALGAAVLGGYAGYNEATKENKAEQARVDANFSNALTGADAHFNSRTMVGSPAEFRALANEFQRSADTSRDQLQLANKVFVGSLGGSNANSMTFRAKGDNRPTAGPSQTANELAYEQARKQLPNGTAEDLAELTTKLLQDARAIAQAPGELARLSQAVDDFQQGADNLTARAAGTYGRMDNTSEILGAAGYATGNRNQIGRVLAGSGVDEGLGLGGYDPSKSPMRRRHEAEVAKEEARVQQQKNDYAGLIDGITAPLKGTLLARIVNPEDFKDTAPGKGPE